MEAATRHLSQQETRVRRDAGAARPARATLERQTQNVWRDEVDEQPWDGWLLVIVCALLGLGLVMIFSSSAVTAAWTYHDPLFFLKRQLLFLCAGFVLLYVGLRIDYRWYQRAVYPILMGTVGLLVWVAFAGHTAGGATRWINIGPMTFQPGEWTKIAIVMVLAYSMAKKGDRLRSFAVGIVPHLLVVGGIVGLLMMQPDFGTSVILLTMMFTLLFVAGGRLSYIMVILFGAGVVAYELVVSSEYRMKRVMAFLDPWSHQSDIAYQVTESMIAIGSGGISGMGLGDGLGKLGFVPELETDFIGTGIAQELGFFGIALVIILFLLLIWRGVRIAISAKDTFGTYLAFGLTILFGLQAAVNLGVISGMLPTKGLTLPFISYGGSSLLCSMFGVGVLLSISRNASDEWEARRRQRDREREELRWQKKRQRIIERRAVERAR